MKLYLTRHGESTPADINPDQPLSESGRAGVERLAAFLQENKNVRVSRICHSGKTRARETADILAKAVGPGLKLEEIAGIKPNDPIQPFADQIASWTNDTLVVGHLPFMGKLVSHLLTGDKDMDTVIYRAATVVCLEKLEDRWLMGWMVNPELVS